MSAETLLQTKLRISVVDDDESVRKALGRLLSSLDYQAETFDSGRAFLDSLADRCPDFLVLDLHMPGLSGLDVLQQLTRTSVPVRVIVITAHDEPETQTQCLAAGALAYLRKPLDEQVLLSAIRTTEGHNAWPRRSREAPANSS
jgi:FixJ family two-component response regulator